MRSAAPARIAAVLGFLAVALGAFGAHGLKEVLVRHGTVEIWEKAVLYHLVHAVVLFVIGLRAPLLKGPWFSFVAGIILFSGSLYILALTGVRWWGAVTPF